MNVGESKTASKIRITELNGMGDIQVSAIISPDDYRDLIAFFEPNSEEEPSDVPNPSASRLPILFLICAIALLIFVVFTKGLHQSIEGLSNFAHNPVSLSILAIMLLLAVFAVAMGLEARAFDWTRSYDRLDHAALREGVNLGKALFALRPDGLGVTFALGRSFHAWRAFEGFFEGPHAFYLEVSGGQSIVVPKRAFGDEASRQDFANFLLARIEALS